ncbi:Coenzyme F420 hydrogenase/dehydrogenase, beta subunit C-terminal domain [Gordonia sp. p3-SID1431]|uniref:Coenzyme F420 hydrogenase/dehydrogenase, beta subunit C-terminal domain n=1 Tax=Gordonia sp. p3-SID1431 TaxID=2916159 RepID=UPI0037BEE2F1
MALDGDRYLRPIVASNSTSRPREPASVTDDERTQLFSRICPGVFLRAPDGPNAKGIFGRYEAAFSAYATDAETRKTGSSGGVLTALQQYLVAEQGKRVIAAGPDSQEPTKSAGVVIASASELRRSVGSRYAPVSSLDNREVFSKDTVFVGKPCEASPLAQICKHMNRQAPITLSFFCAGTPSQEATNDVLQSLGCRADAVTSLRYRGDGWPGRFTATTDTQQLSMSYEESWGQFLGRDVQWRCKLCVDGTGADADVSVGDFWSVDERGYPVFRDADGLSVAVARTPRGLTLLKDATEAGYIRIEEIDLERVVAVQPLQRDRKRTLIARLAGRRLARRAVPRYRGYGLWTHQVRSVKDAPRALVRTLVRSRQTAPDGGELSRLSRVQETTALPGRESSER